MAGSGINDPKKEKTDTTDNLSSISRQSSETYLTAYDDDSFVVAEEEFFEPENEDSNGSPPKDDEDEFFDDPNPAYHIRSRHASASGLPVSAAKTDQAINPTLPATMPAPAAEGALNTSELALSELSDLKRTANKLIMENQKNFELITRNKTLEDLQRIDEKILKNHQYLLQIAQKELENSANNSIEQSLNQMKVDLMKLSIQHNHNLALNGKDKSKLEFLNDINLTYSFIDLNQLNQASDCLTRRRNDIQINTKNHNREFIAEINSLISKIEENKTKNTPDSPTPKEIKTAKAVPNEEFSDDAVKTPTTHQGNTFTKNLLSIARWVADILPFGKKKDAPKAISDVNEEDLDFIVIPNPEVINDKTSASEETNELPRGARRPRSATGVFSNASEVFSNNKEDEEKEKKEEKMDDTVSQRSMNITTWGERIAALWPFRKKKEPLPETISMTSFNASDIRSVIPKINTETPITSMRAETASSYNSLPPPAPEILLEIQAGESAEPPPVPLEDEEPLETGASKIITFDPHPPILHAQSVKKPEPVIYRATRLSFSSNEDDRFKDIETSESKIKPASSNKMPAPVSSGIPKQDTDFTNNIIKYLKADKKIRKPDAIITLITHDDTQTNSEAYTLPSKEQGSFNSYNVDVTVPIVKNSLHIGFLEPKKTIHFAISVPIIDATANAPKKPTYMSLPKTTGQSDREIKNYAECIMASARAHKKETGNNQLILNLKNPLLKEYINKLNQKPENNFTISEPKTAPKLKPNHP